MSEDASSDSELLQQLIAAGPTGTLQAKRRSYPDNWQPRAEIDEQDGGYVVSTPQPATEAPRSHAELLSEFGLSEDDWSVERVRQSRWQSASGEWLESKRLSLLPKRLATASRVDLDKLCQEIAGFEAPLHGFMPNASGATFVHAFGDTQIGKVDGGGTERTVRRVLDEVARGVRRYELLEEQGRSFDEVVIPQLGDCIEGVNSQGGALVKRTDLGLSEMVRVYRRLLWTMVKKYAEMGVERILVPVAPGNHDQAIRISNQDASWASDSWAVEAASAVQDAIEQTELKDRVRFLFPERDKLTVAFETSGTVIGLAHGHQFKGGWQKWWAGQASGRTDVGDADLLMAGHLHHLHVQDFGGNRLFLQIPALDGGSQWFSSMTGENSRSRSVTFWTKDRGVYDLDPVL